MRPRLLRARTGASGGSAHGTAGQVHYLRAWSAEHRTSNRCLAGLPASQSTMTATVARIPTNVVSEFQNLRCSAADQGERAGQQRRCGLDLGQAGQGRSSRLVGIAVDGGGRGLAPVWCICGQVRVGPPRTAVLGVQIVGGGEVEMLEDRLRGDLDPGKAVGIDWTLVAGKVWIGRRPGRRSAGQDRSVRGRGRPARSPGRRAVSQQAGTSWATR